MFRRAAAILVALTVFPAVLHAQDTVFTVSVQSADVHKGPSTGAPVVGHAASGTVLPVLRDLGSWLQVTWASAPEGFGYVHLTTGRLNARGANTSAAAASPRASSTSPSAPAPVPLTTVPRAPSTGDRVAPAAQQGGTPISHLVGVGGLIGSMSSFGATARWWRDKHLGLQIGVTRDAITSDLAEGRVTSMQIEPGVVYALFDRVRDYVWVRPYVGSALSFRHQTLKVPVPDPNQPTSDNGIGFRAFGGGELTFASATQFGLSAEVGYRRLPTPFAGFEPDRFSVSILGHWYIR
jgi:hypothetical protein